MPKLFPDLTGFAALLEVLAPVARLVEQPGCFHWVKAGHGVGDPWGGERLIVEKLALALRALIRCAGGDVVLRVVETGPLNAQQLPPRGEGRALLQVASGPSCRVWRRLLKLWRNPRAFFFDAALSRIERLAPHSFGQSVGLGLLRRLGSLRRLKEANRRAIKRHMRNGDLTLRSFPKLMHVEMTTYCNIKCRMCSIIRPNRGRKLQHIDMEVIEKLRPVLPYVSDVKMHGGGEPFLNPNIERIMEVFQQYGVKLNTVTNATVITERLARLIGRNFSTLTISIDGTTPEVFEQVRQGASLARVLRSVEWLNRYRHDEFRLIFGMVLLRCNVHQLPDLVKLAKERGAQEVQAAWVVPFPELPWSMGQDPTREPERVNELLRQTYEVAERLGIALKLPPFLPVGGEAGEALQRHTPNYYQLHPTNRVEGKCQLMYDRAMVLVDGTIKPCGQSQTVEDLGSLKHKSFADIWSGPGYQRLRRTFNEGTMPATCSSCNFIRAGQLGPARLVLDRPEGVRLPLMPLEVQR